MMAHFRAEPRTRVGRRLAPVKPWMLYTFFTVITWGLWGVFSKLASNYTKPRQSILFQTAGVLAFALVVLVLERFHIEWNGPGFIWSALGGFFAFIGFSRSSRRSPAARRPP
jgi:drug/metabolite transporter (DMT)-like permease